jgi:hypothetical protein
MSVKAIKIVQEEIAAALEANDPLNSQAVSFVLDVLEEKLIKRIEIELLDPEVDFCAFCGKSEVRCVGEDLEELDIPAHDFKPGGVPERDFDAEKDDAAKPEGEYFSTQEGDRIAIPPGSEDDIPF